MWGQLMRTELTLRPKSSVAVGFNEDGEMVFTCDGHGPVIHRTPEELGLPRTVADCAGENRRSVRPDAYGPRNRAFKGIKTDRPRYRN